MADNWTRSIICRYYKNGHCPKGDECTYRHARSQTAASTATASGGDMIDLHNDKSDISSDESPFMSCRFFKLGTCKFGNHCRFDHSSSQHETTLKNEAQQRDILTKSQFDCNSTATTSTHAAHSSFSSHITSMGSSKESKRKNYDPEEWVKAPEFVPFSILTNEQLDLNCDMTSGHTMPKSYARAVNNFGQSSDPASEPLCPDAEANGICKQLNCHYLHGDICDMCGRAALHPYNKQQSQQHTSECVKQHEADMELSFAIQRSRDKTCGVCFEIVMEKSSREQRFGILPNCNHCFCLECIRKWRQAKQFDNKIIRSCPECRVTSDFVCPSTYWVDTKEEKEKLIVEYKVAMSLKDCKYFNKGQGKCPFGNKCFYLHALPDGTKTDVGPPARQGSDGDHEIDLAYLQQQILLWSFLEERDNRYLDDHDDLVVLFYDSDDSDWSRFGSHD